MGKAPSPPAGGCAMAANDWIKMRVNLWTHPKVLTLAVKLQVPKATVIGCLHGVWTVADQHAKDDGRLEMAAEVLDSVIETPGFCLMLEAVGWITIGDGWVQFIDYAEHNGSTAKSRAENTNRQRTSRSCRASVAQKRDASATRGEESREDTPPTPSKHEGAPEPENRGKPEAGWGGIFDSLLAEDVCSPGAVVRMCSANGLTPHQVDRAIRVWREKSGRLGPGLLVDFLKELRPGETLAKILSGGASVKAEQRRRNLSEAERRRAEEAAELEDLSRDAGRQAWLRELSGDEAERIAAKLFDDGTGGGLWRVWCRQCRHAPRHEWPAAVRLEFLREAKPREVSHV
jgi:hypothetical protein